MIDLHTHSTASDGRLSPTALIKRAAECGVTRLALTDHDTTAGVPEARDAATSYGIELIAGVEISATWRRRTLHIVGLNIDLEETTLASGLASHQALRIERARSIADRLARHGLRDGYTRAADAAQGGQITRAHFANLLVSDGICRDTAQAFKRFLRPGKPGYQRSEWSALESVIDWTHAAGGIAVLAHPFGYRFTGAWRRAAVGAFAAGGGDGLEICTGVSTIDQESQSARDAYAHGLFGSKGSDFHSPEQFWLEIGRVRELPKNVVPIRLAG